MKFIRSILLTGGAGFIGSHVARLFVNKYPDYHIVTVDKLTYAGNLANLKDLEDKPNHTFVKADICDYDRMLEIINKYDIDGIIHLAAESHVDRSIKDPFVFAQTNVMGTLSLLQAAKESWEFPYDKNKFYHISTDEVYGTLQFDNQLFTEETKYDPHSPYSASKASSDHFVRAFYDTYKLPIIVTNCSNNYGPYQFPEKLIPLFINNIRHKKPLPVYGKGENVRDWLYVVDHARAIDVIFHEGKLGDTYNIGGFNEWKNIDIVKLVIKTVDRLLGNAEGTSDSLITYVTDRAGHDLRYAIDSTKLKNELKWEPSLQFEEGIEKTVKWYLDNQDWLDNIISGDYQNNSREFEKNKVQLIQGNIFTDSRGVIKYFNTFNFKNVERFYLICQSDIDVVRGWHGHKFESKWFFCAKGSFVLSFVRPDNWDNPSPNLESEIFHLDENTPQILFLPEGYANCIRATKKDSILLVYSETEIEEAKKDSWRWPSEMWGGDKI